MRFLEKDLEEIIFTSCKEELGNKGIQIPKLLFRQLRIGKYGIADFVGFDRARKTITVYELKQDNVSVSAFIQGIRYVKGIKQFLSKRKLWRLYHCNINLILVGRKIDLTSDIVYLPDIISIYMNFELKLLTYSYDLDGITFTEHRDYSLMDEGF